MFVLDESRTPQRRRVDLAGAALATAGLVALVYGFDAASTHGWTAPVTVGTIGAGLVGALVFVAIEARVREPLLPLGIVAHRNRGGAYLAFMLVMVGMFGMFLLVSFYLQTVAGYTALAAGVAFLPFAAGTLIASTLVRHVMTRVRSGLLLATGLLLAATGMGFLTQLDVDSSYTRHSLGDDAVLLDVSRAFPGTSRPLVDYHQVLLRGSSPFSEAERELIAAYVSGLNACHYCLGRAGIARCGVGVRVVRPQARRQQAHRDRPARPRARPSPV